MSKEESLNVTFKDTLQRSLDQSKKAYLYDLSVKSSDMSSREILLKMLGNSMILALNEEEPIFYDMLSWLREFRKEIAQIGHE